MVEMWLTPRVQQAWVHSADVNCLPWSDVRRADNPNLATQLGMKVKDTLTRMGNVTFLDDF